MSLESALDEERRAVMEILEGRRPSAPRPLNAQTAGRSLSPAGAAVSPVRSMLDVGNAPPLPLLDMPL